MDEVQPVQTYAKTNVNEPGKTVAVTRRRVGLSSLSEKSLELASNSRRTIIEMTSRGNAAHVGSALSALDLTAVAYTELRISPLEWTAWTSENILIFSKGHAAAALYSVLGHEGFFPKDWLSRYSQDGSELGGHVTFGVPGVELSTGSLGHGLPFGVGVAVQRLRQNLPGRIVVVMSDGELDEGSTWESLLIASHHNLKNLVVLVDRNRLQSLEGTEETLALEPLNKKFEAFGWEVKIVDGHNHEDIEKALAVDTQSQKPRAIIGETTKGKGVSFMENEVKWHYRPPNPEELSAALKELADYEK